MTAQTGRDILKVWAAEVNANGGICGRKVNMITMDDKGSTSQDSAEVKQLVEQDHVVAFVGNITALTLAGRQSYLESKHVPVIGGDLSSAFFSSPDYFPQGADGNEDNYAAFKAAQAFATAHSGFGNGTKIGYLYCAESTSCIQGFKDLNDKQIPQKAGSQIVYSKEDSLTQISFTSECQAAKQAGATVLFAGGDQSFVERVANSCGQQGIKFIYLANGASVSDNQQTNQYLNNSFLIATTNQAWPATSSPGSAAFAAAIARYGPGTEKSGTSMSGWSAALLAQQVITSIGSAAVTPASVLAALYKVSNYTINGLSGPLTFHSGGQTSPQCTGTVSLDNAKFTAVNGGVHVCRSGGSLG